MNDQLRRRSIGAPAARSALLTILGEYVLPAGEGVWQETLVGALRNLDYKEHAARQALARSVSAGWLRAERHGRRSRVYLTAETAEMLLTGAERIYSFGEPWEWQGQWLLVVLRVPEERRDVRHQARTQLAWAGFGSLGGGLWISPHIERERDLRPLSGNGSVAELQSFRAEVGQIGDPRTLVADAWDLEQVASEYRDFISSFGRVRPKTPEAAFRSLTLLVHRWRKFPFLDPDLPESLLPARWPRSRAHDLFHACHAEWREAAEAYFASLERVLRPAA